MTIKSTLCAVALPVVYTVARVADLFKPMGHLMDWYGEPYMLRWNIIPDGTLASKVLHFFTGYRSVRLHHINDSDQDRDLHNHPFTYKTLILKGGYIERYLDTFKPPAFGEAVRDVMPGDVVHGDSWLYHRIAYVPDGGSWSLFMMRDNSHSWGFLVDGVYMDRREYFRRKREAGARW